MTAWANFGISRTVERLLNATFLLQTPTEINVLRTFEHVAQVG